MILQVELREKIDPFDFKCWTVQVPCSQGSQKLRWLAYAACLRMALDTGDMPSKFVPQAVKTPDGTALDINKNIKDQLAEGSKVIVECSSGPEAFTELEWDGREKKVVTNVLNFQDGGPKALTELECDERVKDPVKNAFSHQDRGPNAFTELECDGRVKEPLTNELNCQDDSTVCDVDVAASNNSTNILTLLDWSSYGIEPSTDVKDLLASHVGSLQALVIWYSCQGKELEDKDFGVLNLDQFIQIFHDAIGNAEITDDALRNVFEEQLKVKEKGSYQLTLLDFFPAIISVVSGMPNVTEDGAKGSDDMASKINTLIKDCLIPALNRQIMPYLQDLQTISRNGCLEVLRSSNGSLESCLKAPQLKNASTCDLKVPFMSLLPFLRKWLVLEKYWEMRIIAVLVIHAFHGHKSDVIDLIEIPYDLPLGLVELQEFLLGASHWCQKHSTSPIKISTKAYLQEYLKSFFVNAGVAKLPYTTYDEKKDYLRSILLKKEE